MSRRPTPVALLRYAKSEASDPDVRSGHQSALSLVLPLVMSQLEYGSATLALADFNRCSMQHQGWMATRKVDGSIDRSRTCTGWVPRSVLNSDWAYSSRQRHSVCDRQPPTSWSCHVHDAAPSTTEHLLSLQLVYGSEQSASCRTLCDLFEQLQESRIISRHISSIRHTAAYVAC